MQQFEKGANGNSLNYPITQNQLDILTPSNLASPRVGNPHEIILPSEYDDLKKFAEEIEVVRSMVARREFPRAFMEKYYPSSWGVFPDRIPEPLAMERLSFFDPVGLANVVHMDNPLDLGKAIHKWLMMKGYKPVKKTTTGHNEFLDAVCDAMRGMSTSITDALDKAFEIKYHFGVARPEEVLGYNMTHYPEGCPTHPAFPAGHGAVSGATGKFFIDNFELDEVAIKIIRDSVYIWAMARSFAGVHYAQDNLAGLHAGGLSDVPYSGFS